MGTGHSISIPIARHSHRKGIDQDTTDAVCFSACSLCSSENDNPVSPQHSRVHLLKVHSLLTNHELLAAGQQRT